MLIGRVFRNDSIFVPVAKYLAPWWAKHSSNWRFPDINWSGFYSIRFKPCRCAYFLLGEYSEMGSIFDAVAIFSASCSQLDNQSIRLKGCCFLLLPEQSVDIVPSLMHYFTGSGAAAWCDCPIVLEATLKNFDRWLTKSYIIITTK